MEYGRILREAWRITKRTRVLWWLGAIAAAQLFVYGVIVGGLATPLAMMPQFAATIANPAANADAAFVDAREQVLIGVADWLAANLATIAAVTAAVFAVWIVLGVLDVAAQAAIVTQVDAVAERRPASLGAGMANGFRLWLRTVALLALAALPTLVYLLVLALVMFFTVSMPLFQGRLPGPAAALVANLVLSPLSVLVTAASIPLSVLVQLALRFALIDEVNWRPAFRSAWDLVKSNLAEMVSVYGLMLVVAFVVTLAFLAIASVTAAVVGLLVFVVWLAVASGDAGAAGRVALVGAAGFAALLYLTFQAVMFVWQSAVWTLAWRDRTGRSADAVLATVPVSGMATEGGV